jgi:chaperonin cofactor prefoldin
MTNDPEIQDIVNQLQQLQIQQSALIERLEQLNKGNNASKNTAPQPCAP